MNADIRSLQFGAAKQGLRYPGTHTANVSAGRQWAPGTPGSIAYLFLAIRTESGIAKSHGFVIFHVLRYGTHLLPDIKIVRH
jgi:hypothetical protein